MKSNNFAIVTSVLKFLHISLQDTQGGQQRNSQGHFGIIFNMNWHQDKAESAGTKILPFREPKGWEEQTTTEKLKDLI